MTGYDSHVVSFCFSAMRHVLLIRGFIESSTRSSVLPVLQIQKFENTFYITTVVTVVLGLRNWLLNLKKTDSEKYCFTERGATYSSSNFNSHQTARCHMPHDSVLRSYRHENLKSYKIGLQSD